MSTRKLLLLLPLAALATFLIMGQVSGWRPWSSVQWQVSTTSPQLPAEFSYASINKFGFNGAIAAAEEVVWVGSTTYNYPSSAVTMTIVSDDADDAAAGTGARTVKIYCLDTGHVPFSEIVTLNGLTPVPHGRGLPPGLPSRGDQRRLSGAE